MSFLNPLVLFGLFAASIPILIHLFTRTKSRTIPFSTLEFLKELQNQQIRRIKLRQILLLILRTLIIILIILAFARPTLRGSLSGISAPHAKTSMALIIDNSVSMARPHNGALLFDTAKDKALDILTLARAGDEMFVISTTDTTNELFRRSFHDADIVSNAISDLKINHKSTNISAALALASRLVERSLNINKEIYVISDLQNTGFTSDSLQQRSENVRIYAVPLRSESIRNVAVQDIQLATTIVEQGKIAEIVTTIANTGERDIDNTLAQLFINNKRVAQNSIQLEAGAATTQVFRFTVEGRGFTSARVVLEDDDILQDNERALSFYVPENVQIALAGYEPQDIFYPNLVLDPSGIGPDYYAIQNLSFASVRFTPLDQFDVVLFSNIPSFEQQTSEKLAQFVEDGGGLLLILGENIDIRSFNTVLSPALKVPQFIDILGSAQQAQADFTLGTYDLTHPIFYGVFDKQEAEIAEPRFRFAVKVEESANIDPIMSFSNGDPLLFERKLGQGTILVMTTGLDLQLSDITHRTIFAPLMIRLVGYAGTAGTNRENEILVGEEIRYKIQPQDVNKSLEIRQQSDKYDRLKPTMSASGAWIEYNNTTTPGIYELLVDGSVVNVWAVQIDPRESNLAQIDKRKLQDNFNAVILSENAVVSETISLQRHGTELWKYFVMAALILLLIEMLLYREAGEVPTEKVAQTE